MFLGIDLGTSSLKALVLDVDGSIVGTGSASYPVTTPQPGWAESHPQAGGQAPGTAVREATGGHPPGGAAGGPFGPMRGGGLSGDARAPPPPARLPAAGA